MKRNWIALLFLVAALAGVLSAHQPVHSEPTIDRSSLDLSSLSIASGSSLGYHPICGPGKSITDCDAELLAMELSGDLLPPTVLYNQIRDDLALIRTAYPKMGDIFHTPPWEPGKLSVQLTSVAWEQYQSGNYHGLDSLNGQYGPVTTRVSIPQWLHLEFETRYNPESLAAIYATADGVQSAEPSHIVGQSSTIQVSWPEYTFNQGWGDCFSGCIYSRFWTFYVSGGSATLIRVGGDPLVSSLDVVVSEVAWMGTTVSSDDEWIELYNHTHTPIDLTGWTLDAADGTPSIALSGTIPAGGYFLLERADDTTVPGVTADITYTGGLANDGEHLVLRDDTSLIIDQVDCSAGWFAGHNDAKVPMVRVHTLADGSDAANWTHNPRCGTATNSAGARHECLATVAVLGHPLDYAVYFNDRATTATGTTLDHTPMEDALLGLIASATTGIDAAIYGLDRQSVVDALIAAHNSGVTVRVVGDDEAATVDYSAHYQQLTAAGITVTTDTDLGKTQHNKFMVFDGAVVWTGSTNLTDTGLTLNANNSIVITDTTLAANYTAEFEEMWAGSFDGAKTINTLQYLDYVGTSVENFFSPTDLAAFEVWSELAKVEETIHFAMFYWTDDLISKRVVERIEDGVQVYGVWDQLGAANASSQDEMLCAAGARIGIEDLPGKVHHKFAVIDVGGSDPRVILGSYNWTNAGAYRNDENMLIVHNRALAQAYVEEWQRLWETLPLDRICNPHGLYLPVIQRSWDRGTLLRNPDFEGTYRQFAHFTGIVMAPEWLPWWKAQGGDDEPWQNRMPEYKPAAPYGSRIHSGSNAQQYFSYWGTHVGGIYQVVSGIAPGSKMRFVVWGQAWSGSGDDPSHSENPSPMHMRVGIDPNGGTNPWSASIVWSAEQEPIDTWLSFAVEAQANADKVTVFTWSAPDHPVKHNDVFWDDASLVVVSLPTPTPTVPVYCTPPPCNLSEGEVYHCPSECPGGCGTVCATVTPAPAPPVPPSSQEPTTTSCSNREPAPL